MKPAARLALRHRLLPTLSPAARGGKRGPFLCRKAVDMQAALCYARGKEREKIESTRGPWEVQND